MSVRALVLAVVLAGCGYRPSFADCEVRCRDGVCPAGYACGADGRCRADGVTGCPATPDAFDPACIDVVCDEVMPATCLDGSVVRTFASPGTCEDGTCSYPHDDVVCVGACSAGRCDGRWSVLAQQDAPQPRFGHTAVWTGREMIVWGGAVSSTGSLGDGARYDPATGAWTAIATTGAPSPRRDHGAVWTGREMIVWGGASITQGTPLGDGAIYDPALDRWRPLPTAGAPGARFGHSAVWTGVEMIVWGGGVASTASRGDGARFDPATGQWTAIEDVGAPSPRRDHSAVWTGTEMLAFGGSTIYAGGAVFGDAAAYDPRLDRWTTSTTTNTPQNRFSHTAVWTGTEMLMFGGAVSSTGTLGDGARLSGATAQWAALPAAAQPSPRRRHTAVWTGTAMIVWGGSTIVDGGGVFADGAALVLYEP